MAPTSRLDNVISLCKRRGFVFPSGEIYGGTRSAWDYGPLGVELKENIKRQWWRTVVTSRDDVVGLDSSVILPRQVWVASGHVGVFTDPLVECLHCHKRFRADHLQEDFAERKGLADPDAVALTEVACPNCGTRGQWTEPRDFNMMLKTYLGVDRGRVRAALPAPGDRAGHLRQLRQRRADHAGRSRRSASARWASSFRNEITPGQLHLPHPRVRADGDGVLRRAGHRRGVAPVLDRRAHPLVHRPRHRRRQPAALRAPAGEAVALLQAHRRHRVPLRLRRQRVGRARGHRQPHRLRPQDPQRALRHRPVLLRPGLAASGTCRTSSSRRPA